MSVYTMFSVPIIHYEIENWAENKQKIMAALPDHKKEHYEICLLYTSPSPRDKRQSRMPSSA